MGHSLCLVDLVKFVFLLRFLSWLSQIPKYLSLLNNSYHSHCYVSVRQSTCSVPMDQVYLYQTWLIIIIIDFKWTYYLVVLVNHIVCMCVCICTCVSVCMCVCVCVYVRCCMHIVNILVCTFLMQVLVLSWQGSFSLFHPQAPHPERKIYTKAPEWLAGFPQPHPLTHHTNTAVSPPHKSRMLFPFLSDNIRTSQLMSCILVSS